MARRSKIYHCEPNEWFSCPVHGCSQKFRSQTGRTKHIRAKHKKNNELPVQTRSSFNLSASSKIVLPPASVNTSLPIDLDSDCQPEHDITPEVPVPPSENDPTSPPPFQPEIENQPPPIDSDSDHQPEPDITMPEVPVPPSNNDPTPPPPFQPEIAHQVLASSTNHPYINGTT